MFPRKRAGFVVLAATVALTAVRAAANPGDLDPTFGTGGLVITSFGRSGVVNAGGVANAVAVQADGKIVAAGGTGGLNGVLFAVSRYNEDGSLDATFGAGGKVTTSFGGTYDYALAVVLQGDGKIVAAGYTRTSSAFHFALARYNHDGSLDASFGTGGQVTTSFGRDFDVAIAVALQDDGKIVASGTTASDSAAVFALARYNTDGSLDATFGTGGQVTTNFGGTDDEASAVAVQGDGKIVAAGHTAQGVGSAQFAVARYNGDGSLDGTFGTAGQVTTSFAGNDFAGYHVALQGDGKIVAAGFAGPPCQMSPCVSGNLFALARYNTDGSLDPTFGTTGQVTTSFGGIDDEDFSFALQGDGKIVAAGLTRTGSNNRFALARYNGDGSLDAIFGTGGKVTTSFGGTYDQALAVALQGDGKIVAAGWTEKAPGSAQFALARYLNDATPVTTTTTTPSTTATSTSTTSSTSSTTTTTLRPKACRRACRHEAKACAGACGGRRQTHRLCKRACRNQRKNCGGSTACQLPPA